MKKIITGILYFIVWVLDTLMWGLFLHSSLEYWPIGRCSGIEDFCLERWKYNMIMSAFLMISLLFFLFVFLKMKKMRLKIFLYPLLVFIIYLFVIMAVINGHQLKDQLLGLLISFLLTWFVVFKLFDILSQKLKAIRQ